MPKGSWEYSEFYRDILVAKDWNISPTEFWEKSRLDRAIMIAYCMETPKMALYEQNKKS